MKTLNCRSCSAPVVLKKGIARQKCAFCETELSLDFAQADEVKEIDSKIFEKYKKRCEDSKKRGFIGRYKNQWQTLSDYVGDDLSSQRSIDIRAKAYSAKSYYFLDKEYNIKDGDTTKSVKREIKYANTLGASVSWTRLDKHYTDMLIMIEDYCETLDKETREKFLISYFKHYKKDMEDIMNKFFNYLTNSLSWTEKGSDEFGVNTWDGPVCCACSLRFDQYAMLFKFFNDLHTISFLSKEALTLSEEYNSWKTTNFKPAKRLFGDRPSKWANNSSINDAENESKKFEQALEPYKEEARKLQEIERQKQLKQKISKFLENPRQNHSLSKKDWPSNPELLNSKRNLLKKFNDFAKDFEEAGKFNEAWRIEFNNLVKESKILLIKPKIVLLLALFLIITGNLVILTIISLSGYLIWLRKAKKPLMTKISELEEKAFKSIK